MKARRIANLLAAILFITLTGCGGRERSGRSGDSHTHYYDTANIQWSWTYVGERNYNASATFICLACDYSTEGHTVTIPATVNYEITREATCQSDGEITYTATVSFEEGTYYNQKRETLHNPDAHTYIENPNEEFLYRAPTCTEDAMYYKSCIHCHEMSTETFTVPGTKLGHHMIHHARVESTCYEYGNIEYYYCDRCMKYFTEEAGVNVITLEDTILPFSHDMTEHKGHEAGCGVDGQLTYYTCSKEPGVYFKDIEGTSKFDSYDEIIIPAPAAEHEFNENLVCKHCGESFKELHDLKDVKQEDLLLPTTLSDLGIESQYVPDMVTATDPEKVHLFGNYDFSTNNGIDLWLKMNYFASSGDNYWLIYLFNQRNEDGIVFRLQLNRTDDDGILPMFIYTNMEHQEGSTVVTGAGNDGTYFYFPRFSGTVSEVDNLLHITAVCVDKQINKYRCAITIGQSEEEQYYPSANPEDASNLEKTFDIVLGKNYFNNNSHNVVRISSNLSNAVYIDNYAKEIEKEVIYKDAFGNVIGSLAGATATLPALQYENHTFIGWFDSKGNRVADQSPVTGKLVLTPRFVDSKTNMFTLSDYGLDTSSNWFYVNSGISGEVASTKGQSVNEGEAIDLYFIYEVTSCTGLDNYTIFGVPYNTQDGSNRIFVRIDEIVGSTAYQGYIYGASLGGAGAEGTYFESSEGFVNTSRLHRTLVHISYSVVGENTIDLTLELTNLVTGSSYSVTRQATFSTNFDVTSIYADWNKFSIIQPVGSVEARITDAF